MKLPPCQHLAAEAGHWDSKRSEWVVRRSCLLCGLGYFPRRWWAVLQVAIRERYRYTPKTEP